MRKPHVNPGAFHEAIANVLLPRLELPSGLARVAIQEVWLAGQQVQPKDALYAETPLTRTNIQSVNMTNVARTIAERPRSRTGGRQSSAGRRWH